MPRAGRNVETVTVLRNRWLARTLSEERFHTAVSDVERLDVERVPALRRMRRAYELRADVTAYDATYVALAEALDCELITADQWLARAACPRCTVRVLQRP
jgi:predicted nucleic acid-binding protein